MSIKHNHSVHAEFMEFKQMIHLFSVATTLLYVPLRSKKSSQFHLTQRVKLGLPRSAWEPVNTSG